MRPKLILLLISLNKLFQKRVKMFDNKKTTLFSYQPDIILVTIYPMIIKL